MPTFSIKLDSDPVFAQTAHPNSAAGDVKTLQCLCKEASLRKKVILLHNCTHLPKLTISSVQFISVTQSCLTLCDPMNLSTPGLPVHHQLAEFTQTHVHRVRNAIQPSHPRLSPSPPTPNPSQHQSLFQ